jgi:hypothetical protein
LLPLLPLLRGRARYVHSCGNLKLRHFGRGS